MTLDEIEATMRVIAKRIHSVAPLDAAVFDALADNLLELADQLNLTAHPVQIRRPKGRRDSRTTTG